VSAFLGQEKHKLYFFLHALYKWHTKLLSIRLEPFVSPKLVLKKSLIFSGNKLMIPIVLFQSLWMFFYGWCSSAT